MKLRNEVTRSDSCCWCSQRRVSTSSNSDQTARSSGFGPQPVGHLDQRRLLRFPKRNIPSHQSRRRTRARALPRLIEKGALLAPEMYRLLAMHGHIQGQMRLEELNESTAAVEGLERYEHESAALSRRCPNDAAIAVGRFGQTSLQILCLGCHSDDIEIGCGGAILRLAAEYPTADISLDCIQRPWGSRLRGGVRGEAICRLQPS